MANSKHLFSSAVKKLIQFSISIGGFAFIFYKIPFAEVYKNWNRSMIPWVISMLIAATLSMLIQANRWKGLSIQGPNIPLRKYYAYTALGYFFNNLLPTGFGGDAIKSLAFGKKYNQTSQSVSAVLLSRIQGLLAMFLCFFIALPFALMEVEIPFTYTSTMCAVLLFCIIFIFGCLFSDKIHIPSLITNKLTFVPKLQKSLSIYRCHKKQFFLSAIDSIWLQLLTLYTSYAYFRAVGIEMNISILVVFTSITIVVSMLPISLNGIGIREGVQIALFTKILGIPADQVLAAGLLGYIPLLFQASQGAIVLATLKKKQN